MSKAEILVPLQGNETDTALIDEALVIASRLDADVATVYAQNDPIDMLAWPSEGSFIAASSTLIASAQAGNDEAWETRKKTVMERAKTAPGLTIERLIGFPETLLGKRATLSDMIVFSCESARGHTSVSNVFSALLLDAHVPVLIPRTPSARGYDKIALAWDGSLEAGRAAKAALPFLLKAKDIVIIQAVDGLDDYGKALCDPSRLQDWLARHDIVATVKMIHSTRVVASEILDACKELGTDLLVCGAYGHSRAREFLFGGVTRTLLNTTSSPSLLLCH